MGEGAGAVQNKIPVGTPDFNQDGYPDTVEWRWAYKTIAYGAHTYSDPVITVAKVRTKDEFVDLRVVRTIQACGKEFTIGNKFEDSKKRKNPISRIVTGFFLKAKQEPNKVSGHMDYGLRLYAQLEPEIPDGTHHKSSRSICGPFFDKTLFADDPDKNSDASPAAFGLQ